MTLDQLRLFIAESENPGNQKGISTVVIELPELAQLRTLRFVDMPGLESTFAHNTETAQKWLPNVGLALVAVAVDPPLSQHDIALIKSLFEYKLLSVIWRESATACNAQSLRISRQLPSTVSVSPQPAEFLEQDCC